MTTRADVRRTLQSILATELRVAVFPHPPQQMTAPVAIYFGPWRGDRESQDGAEEATIPVLVCVPATDLAQCDQLDDFVDGSKSIIDAIDANPDVDGVSFSVSGEWSDFYPEIAGDQFMGVQVDVMARWS